MRKIKIAIMLFGVVAGGLLASTPTAHAATLTRKFHVSTCVAAPVPPNTAAPVFNSAGQVANTDTGKYLELWCPLVSDPDIGVPGGPSPSVKVHVFSNGCAPGDSVGVSTSVGFLPASGGAAVFGGFSAPSNCTPGVYELSPAANASSNADDYPFLRVVLRKFHSGSANVMLGYTLSVTTP
jgi:hypothetical protein